MVSNETQSNWITCSLCGFQFDGSERGEVCRRCSILGSGGCHSVRCPRCGYEAPMPARLPSLFARITGRLSGSFMFRTQTRARDHLMDDPASDPISEKNDSA
jgi:anaerobic ribonucleoside-triphosphate reductase